MAIPIETQDMYRQMYGTDAPPEVIQAMRDKSVGELADALRSYGPGGMAGGALGGDLLSGIRGIYERYGLPTALENYNRIASLLTNLPEDIMSRTQGSMEPMTESQRRALEASERDPLSRQLSEAGNYVNLLESLVAPEVSALETEYAYRQRQPTSTATAQAGTPSVSRAMGGGGGGGGGGTANVQDLPKMGDYETTQQTPVNPITTTGQTQASFSRNLFGGLGDLFKAWGIERAGTIPSASQAITSARSLLGLKG